MGLTPPFYCDHGDKIYFGKHFYANTGLTILDENVVAFGDDGVIGSGSVVTKDIPGHVIAAGVPCKVIRGIAEDDIIFWKKELEGYQNDVASRENRYIENAF